MHVSTNICIFFHIMFLEEVCHYSLVVLNLNVARRIGTDLAGASCPVQPENTFGVGSEQISAKNITSQPQKMKF